MSINKSKSRFGVKSGISRKSNAGFTLIEIMVSLLVLSIGLLGMMALQNVALRHNQSAFYESQATFLANDILDRMRAGDNPVAYNIALGSNIPAAGTNCETSFCNSAAMAQWDLNQWRTSVTVTSKLPQAASRVLYNPATTDVTITIRYDDSRDPLNPQPRDLVINAQI